ncbi:hypothetical protein [Paenibacillus sp. FSL H8-0259]|uniref:hypothetical protein n=1 Tax=Paenibacillus sp. FSL H8-0259 TaxID=1920423 RepID=UPI00096C20C2|nr:hypothetical protein [Paenibacillus sp. FSL H8-0259]OMF21894.1 hypothetical protein BK132_31695 [Paenibacillus sp. FSL H8-0259]
MKEIIKSFQCAKCRSGSNFNPQYVEDNIKQIGLKRTLQLPVVCQDCGNEFSIFQGIIDALVLNNVWPDFICDVNYGGEVEVVVGKEFTIDLPSPVLIEKVFLTNGNAFALVVPRYLEGCSTSKFTIVSSEIEGEHTDYRKVGEAHTVSWSMHGKSGNRYSETWIQLLAQVKELIMHRQYEMAVLSSEIMFESFLDSTIYKHLLRDGSSHDTAYTMLESIPSVQTKAHKLLKSLCGYGLQDNKQINKEWLNLMLMRNKIAHGEDVAADKDKASWAFRTALDSIFYIYIMSDIYE